MSGRADQWPEMPILVRDGEESRAWLREAKCSCGGALLKTFQALATTDEGTMDLITLECPACQKEHHASFLFDEADPDE